MSGPVRKRIREPGKATREGHYARFMVGRKDRAHVKLVYDSIDWTPYRFVRQASAQTVYTEAREIPLNALYVPLSVDTTGTATFSFAGTSGFNYQASRLKAPYEQLRLYGSRYGRYLVTSSKMEFMIRPLPTRVQQNESASMVDETDPAWLGPDQVNYAIFPVNHTQFAAQFQGAEGGITLARVQPGFKMVTMRRGGNNQDGRGGVYLSCFTNVLKHSGRLAPEADGGYTTDIAADGEISTTRPTVQPKLIFITSYYMDDTDPVDSQWYVHMRLRFTYWVTFLHRRAYPNDEPALNLLAHLKAELSLANAVVSPACDILATHARTFSADAIPESKNQGNEREWVYSSSSPHRSINWRAVVYIVEPSTEGLALDEDVELLEEAKDELPPPAKLRRSDASTSLSSLRITSPLSVSSSSSSTVASSSRSNPTVQSLPIRSPSLPSFSSLLSKISAPPCK